MKNQQTQWQLFTFLLVLAMLFPFGAPNTTLAVLSILLSSEPRARREFALHGCSQMLGIRVEEGSPSGAVSPCMKKMIFLLPARLAAMSCLITLKPISQPKATDTTGEKANGSALHHDTPLVGQINDYVDKIPGPPIPSRTCSSTSKRQQATVPKSLSAPQLSGITTLEGIPVLNEGTKILEDMMQPKASLPEPVLEAVVVFQVATEAIGRPSRLTPIVPATGSNTDDDDVRIRRQTPAPLTSETSTNPVESTQTTVAIGDATPPHIFRDQQMITSIPIPETAEPSPTPATLPESQLQTSDIFAAQPQGSMSTPTSIPTGQVNWSHGGSFESGHSGDNVDVECLMRNIMELNTGSDPIAGTLSIDRELFRDALAPTTPSGTQRTLPHPPQADNINRQPYRPRFQSLSPAVEILIGVEQPWSPEHPTTSGRTNRINDVINKYDAIL